MSRWEEIAEQAAVVLDGNAPMSTLIWTDTIDIARPVSHVSGLLGSSSCPSFRVSWSGSDLGSGIQGVTVHASDNGGPFGPCL